MCYCSSSLDDLHTPVSNKDKSGFTLDQIPPECDHLSRYENHPGLQAARGRAGERNTRRQLIAHTQRYSHDEMNHFCPLNQIRRRGAPGAAGLCGASGRFSFVSSLTLSREKI